MWSHQATRGTVQADLSPSLYNTPPPAGSGSLLHPQGGHSVSGISSAKDHDNGLQPRTLPCLCSCLAIPAADGLEVF